MEEIIRKLQDIERLITNDRDLSVKAFGILLLGEKFKKETRKEEPTDPTALILRPGPEIPEF